MCSSVQYEDYVLGITSPTLWPLATLHPPTRDRPSSRPNSDECGLLSAGRSSGSTDVPCTVSCHRVKGTKDDCIICTGARSKQGNWRSMLETHYGSVCLLVGCLTSQQHASVSQGRICTDNFTCCHTEIEAADQTFHLTQSQ